MTRDQDMDHVYPDLEWYAAISQEKSLPPRCPFANVHRCPRYYQSVALLGEKGLFTKIPEDEDKAILARWRATDVWPIVREHATAISGSNWKSTQFSNFCPEVSFDKFQLFASMLCEYVDEIDKDASEKWLADNGLKRDWRWNWAYVEPLHYSLCFLYSQLPVSTVPDQSQKPSKEEILSLKPGAFGMSIDLKKLLSKFCKWWASKNG